ncbi:hypothetical protein [Pseudomonas syringae]|uniref:hypothetical protein n=1 Tax=Pseudomonas syringae TaxID=317 RepID=UPI001F07ABAD|nr:hypothetical protein [Pseudomonas syringae]
MIENVWVAKQIGRPVIKGFNNVLAYTLAEPGFPKGSPGRLAAAVAGNDQGNGLPHLPMYSSATYFAKNDCPAVHS